MRSQNDESRYIISVGAIPIILGEGSKPISEKHLQVNCELLEKWLVAFLKSECTTVRGINKAIIGLSGGVDSAITAYLCAKAFGPENTFVFRMPYKISSQESLSHAQLVIDDLGLVDRVIEITDAVDGYLRLEPEASPTRIGNVCSRVRMTILYDQAAKLGGLPIGTGNKTERLFGYYTWHGDDAPPINPLGDLYKTQLWELARHLGVPAEIINKPATADLVKGQTDEGDFGISYARADLILNAIVSGYRPEGLLNHGVSQEELNIVLNRLNGTHWKRHMPTVAMLSDTAINEFYLRPVDYRMPQNSP